MSTNNKDTRRPASGTEPEAREVRILWAAEEMLAEYTVEKPGTARARRFRIQGACASRP